MTPDEAAVVAALHRLAFDVLELAHRLNSDTLADHAMGLFAEVERRVAAGEQAPRNPAE